jgi:hypothetical protein
MMALDSAQGGVLGSHDSKGERGKQVIAKGEEGQLAE